MQEPFEDFFKHGRYSTRTHSNFKWVQTPDQVERGLFWVQLVIVLGGNFVSTRCGISVCLARGEMGMLAGSTFAKALFCTDISAA